MCFDTMAGAAFAPLSAYQAMDQARLMQHAVSDVINKQRGYGNTAMGATLKNVGQSTPEAYGQAVNTGQASALQDLTQESLAPSTGRFKQTASDKAANSLSNTHAAREQGWQQAAVKQFLNNLLAGQQIGSASTLSKIAGAPLPMQLAAAQQADPWISMITSLGKNMGVGANNAYAAGLFSPSGGGGSSLASGTPAQGMDFDFLG